MPAVPPRLVPTRDSLRRALTGSPAVSSGEKRWSWLAHTIRQLSQNSRPARSRDHQPHMVITRYFMSLPASVQTEIASQPLKMGVCGFYDGSARLDEVPNGVVRVSSYATNLHTLHLLTPNTIAVCTSSCMNVQLRPYTVIRWAYHVTSSGLAATRLGCKQPYHNLNRYRYRIVLGYTLVYRNPRGRTFFGRQGSAC